MVFEAPILQLQNALDVWLLRSGEGQFDLYDQNSLKSYSYTLWERGMFNRMMVLC